MENPDRTGNEASGERRWIGGSLLSMASRLAHIGGWAMELAEKKVLWSEEMHQLMEFPEDREPTFEELVALYPPASQEKIMAALEACAREGTPFDLELEIDTWVGRRMDVRVIGQAARDRHGNIVCIEGALQDITGKKRGEKALVQSEQRFRQLADAMPQIVWTGNPDGSVDYLSRGTDKYTGIELEEAPATRWLMAVHPEDRELALQAWQNAVASEKIFTIEYRLISAADRDYRWHIIRGVPIKDEGGNVIKWYGTATDIHDRRMYEEQIRHFADRLTTTLESITDGFFTLDHEWRFVYLNQEAERLFRRKREELIGRNMWEELGNPGSLYAQYQRALEEKRTIVFEEFHPSLNRWLEARLYPSGDGLAVCFRDISAQKKDALELQRANRALQMISRCNEALIRAEHEQELLSHICKLAVEIGGYKVAWVGYMREDHRNMIEPVADSGDRSYVEQLKTLHIDWSDEQPSGKGPIGRSIRTGKPVIAEEIGKDPSMQPWRELAHKHGLRGGISLPLRERGKLFGVLVLNTTEAYRPAMDEVRLLQELADNLAFGIASLRARRERQRLQEAVLKVAAGVSASTGSAFFEQLVYRMTEALEAQAGGMVRLLPGEPPAARTLAVVVDGQLKENVEYPLQGTASENFMRDVEMVKSDEAGRLFPHPPLLASAGAKAYVGHRLDNSSGEPLGLLFVLYREPVRQTDFIRSTLNIFAARAAAELERQEAEAKIRGQASLLDKAQDAIIVRDTEHRIMYWNKGAERLYGWSQEEAIGKPKVELLFHDPATFAQATADVMRHGEWRGEMTQRRKDGTPLTVEAHWTLLKSETGAPQGILSINTDITQRKAAQRELQRLAFYDPLTQLPNRQLLHDRLQHAMAVSAASQHHGALMLLDLDNFKSLNDTLGHELGDMLLQQVARRLESCVLPSDTVARFGGDEFVVLLETPHKELLPAMDQARVVGERILRAFQQPFHLRDYEHHSTPSIGVTLFCGSDHMQDDLIKRAELAMYQAKAAGRNTLQFFDPEMQATAAARAALERDFRRGLRKEEFCLYYQPQVDIAGRVTGTEALVRWQPASRAPVSPADFIPLAEDTGLILHLGRWVLETACHQLAEWAKQPETAGLTVAVNVSARQFHHPEFVQQVMAVLEHTGANPRSLKLELTESLLVDDMDDTVAKMELLKIKGIGFSLDDFGTGYSSLAYLKRLPLDQLKIDQSFVRDVLIDPNDAAIARTIVALGQTLGLAVIAEGVECEAQRDFLATHGCHAYQGYLFSRPLTAPQLQDYVQQRRAESSNHRH